MIELATYFHGDQMYGDEPYVNHLYRVADKVVELFGEDPDKALLVNLAYLHDVLEDTECKEADLNIALVAYPEKERLLAALSAITKQEGECRLDYIMRCSENRDALKVKVADTLSNLECSIKDGLSKNVAKYTSQIHQLYPYLEVLREKAL